LHTTVLRCFGVVLIALLLARDVTFAGEATLGEAPAPDSVEDLGSPVSRVFEEAIREESILPGLKRRLRDLPPFVRDTRLLLNPRVYYFDRQREDDTRSQAFTYGGGLDYRSGWFKETVALGAALYTSQRLKGERNRDGSGLLQPGQQSYTVFGEAYGALRYDTHKLTLYRQDLQLPYVNRQDTRMTPNTFEGFTLAGDFHDRRLDTQVKYVAGYLTQIRKRDEEEFISMSEAAGVPGSSGQGMTFAGALVQFSERTFVGAINYFVKDTLNIAYTEADHLHVVNDDLALRFKVQGTHQASVGADRLTGESFETWVVGGSIAGSYRGLIVGLKFSTTDTGAPIRSPFGNYPGYLSLMLKDFNRPGEDAWGIGMSYNFERLGLRGFSAFTNYAEGYGARDADSKQSLPVNREFDITFDYRPQLHRLAQGLWLRVRGSILDAEGANDLGTEVRIILNYSIPIL
jgi:hypothetical protein